MLRLPLLVVRERDGNGNICLGNGMGTGRMYVGTGEDGNQGSKKPFFKPNPTRWVLLVLGFSRVFFKFQCAVLDAIHIK